MPEAGLPAIRFQDLRHTYATLQLAAGTSPKLAAEDAHHSPTDDAFPIVTTLGALSIVLARFGRRGLLVDDTAS